MHYRHKKSTGAPRMGVANSRSGSAVAADVSGFSAPEREPAQNREKQKRQITVEMPKVWAGGVGEQDRGCTQTLPGDGRNSSRGRNKGPGGACLYIPQDSQMCKLMDVLRMLCGHLQGCAGTASMRPCCGDLIVPVHKASWLQLLRLQPPPQRNISVEYLRRAQVKEKREAEEERKSRGRKEEARSPPRKAVTQCHLDARQNDLLRDWLREKDRLARRDRAAKRRQRRAEREERRRKEQQRKERAQVSEQEPGRHTLRELRSVAGEFLSLGTELTSPVPQVTPAETPFPRATGSKRPKERGAGQRGAPQMGSNSDNKTTKQAEKEHPRCPLSLDQLRAGGETSSGSSGKSKYAIGVISPHLKDHPNKGGGNFRRRYCSGLLEVLTSQRNRSSTGGNPGETHDQWLQRKAREQRIKEEEERMRRSKEAKQDPQLEEVFLKLARRRVEAKLENRRRIDSGLSASRNPLTQSPWRCETRPTLTVEQHLPGVPFQNAPGMPSIELKVSHGHMPSQTSGRCPSQHSEIRKGGANRHPISCPTDSHKGRRKGGAMRSPESLVDIILCERPDPQGSEE
ncbi:hypothetical protein AAFF_G00083200 [Aldrovandia affinis]|uniref:Uncharacterized protein n=1 Tax=Aldrovandia affinis TaxID=143900 RepID=A0AAD7WCY8_9TELE|nr:hypothetical protein AAFF_G00083200 [Aldrovandia affinis]